MKIPARKEQNSAKSREVTWHPERSVYSASNCCDVTSGLIRVKPRHLSTAMWRLRSSHMPVPAATVNTSRPVHISSTSHSCTPNTVNIIDIYNTIDNKNRQEQTQSRRSTILSAHSRLLCGYGHDRRRTSRDTQSLPSSRGARPSDVARSRPLTAGEVLREFTNVPRSDPEYDEADAPDEDGRYLIASDARDHVRHASITGDNMDGQLHPRQRHVTSFSEPAQYAASRGFCVRSRSALLRDTEGSVTSLSRQCCDVLGPKLCHECAIIKRRKRDTRRYESHLPQVDITEENLATAILVAKNNPEMTMEEIQLKLAQGDILNPVFKHSVQRMHDRKAKEPHEPVLVKSTHKPKISRNASGATYNYFTGIMDLNRKIVSGKLMRKLIQTGDPYRDMIERPISRRNESASFSEGVIPRFISSRKGRPEKKRVSAYYEPPLMPKVCQNTEPFFATYTLHQKP